MILSLKMALRSISSNKMRAMLTMLGIIIGVMALVVLVSLVSGATTSVTDAVNALGNSMLTVTVSDDKGRSVTLDTLDEWMEEDALGLLAPQISDTLTASGREGSGSLSVYGTTPAYYDIHGLQLAMGRWLKRADIENHSYVCVINETAAEELIGYVDCVGEAISINSVKYTIAGVLSDDEDSLTAAFSSGSMVAYVPYSSLIRLSATALSEVTTFYVSAPEGGTMESAEAAITEILMDRFDDDEDAFEVSAQDVLEDTMSSITSVLTILLGGIAAISLVVGGIGIMNIMLVTVTERTREIGIRRAIGAQRSSIVAQFLIEAAMLCGIGGIIGILVGTIGSVVLSKLLVQMTIYPPARVTVGAFALSVALGIVFGVYPAIKASKLQPVEALRAE